MLRFARLMSFWLIALATLLAPAAAFAQYPPTEEGSLEASDTTVRPGEPVTISGDGYEAESEVVITFESTPVVLKTVVTNSAGAFTTTVTVPSNARPGRHFIRSTGRDPDGNIRVLSVRVIVLGGPARRGGGLGRTGNDVLPWVLSGLAAIGVGATLRTVARRRKISA